MVLTRCWRKRKTTPQEQHKDTPVIPDVIHHELFCEANKYSLFFLVLRSRLADFEEILLVNLWIQAIANCVNLYVWKWECFHFSQENVFTENDLSLSTHSPFLLSLPLVEASPWSLEATFVFQIDWKGRRSAANSTSFISLFTIFIYSTYRHWYICFYGLH